MIIFVVLLLWVAFTHSKFWKKIKIYLICFKIWHWKMFVWCSRFLHLSDLRRHAVTSISIVVSFPLIRMCHVVGVHCEGLRDLRWEFIEGEKIFKDGQWSVWLTDLLLEMISDIIFSPAKDKVRLWREVLSLLARPSWKSGCWLYLGYFSDSQLSLNWLGMIPSWNHWRRQNWTWKNYFNFSGIFWFSS